MSLWLGAVSYGPHGGCTLAQVRTRFPRAVLVGCGPGGAFDPRGAVLSADADALVADTSYAVVGAGACAGFRAHAYHVQTGRARTPRRLRWRPSPRLCLASAP